MLVIRKRLAKQRHQKSRCHRLKCTGVFCVSILVALFCAWILYALHGIDISLYSLLHLLAYLGKMAQEFWLEALGHTERISINQNLSITTVTSSNTDSYSVYLT